MTEPFRQCSVDACTADAPKVRGYGMARVRFCVPHYGLEVARPGVPVAAPVVALVSPPAPEAPMVAVVAPERLRASPPPSQRVVQLREEAEARYVALLSWMPTARLVTASEVAVGLGCSMSQARIALRRAAAAGLLRVWSGRGYTVAGYAP